MEIHENLSKSGKNEMVLANDFKNVAILLTNWSQGKKDFNSGKSQGKWKLENNGHPVLFSATWPSMLKKHSNELTLDPPHDIDNLCMTTFVLHKKITAGLSGPYTIFGNQVL